MDVGFRVDMDQKPFFREPRPTVQPDAHVERRSRLDLSQIPFAPGAAPWVAGCTQ